MISLPIRNMTGAEVGTYEFPPEDLASGINKQLLHDVVVMYEANRRVGTVQTKSRGMVEGSTRKLFRQKGTGRARAGNIRTPVRRGGGHTFAKVTRDWGYRLPKKAVRLATRMALLSKFQDDQAFLVDEISFAAPKTRDIVAVIGSLGLGDASLLIVTPDYSLNVWKSARNLPGVKVSPVSDLNAYDLLRQRNLLIAVPAIDRVRGVEAAVAAG